MPACPRDNQYSTLPPPGFNDANVAIRSGQLIELLEKVIEKVQREPELIEQQAKQTDLLVSIANLTLLSTSISLNDRRDFLNKILIITQTLLTDENNNIQINSSIDSSSPSDENKDTISTVPPSDPSTNDNDGDFSLDDLANEYLQNEPTPSSSSNDKPTISSESEEPDLNLDNVNKTSLSSSPLTPPANILSKIISPLPSNDPMIIKPPLESILFSNRLSSHDAADDADCIWKEDSSLFGQMFCQKIEESSIIATKRISTCIFDRSLYERLTRLIALLPKQCIRNSTQQLSIRHNDHQQQQQQHRSQRSNNDYRRPSNRPTFQQNSSQQRYPPVQNSRQYNNSNYSNQQGNANGYFADRRLQQQQNRYPPPTYAQYSVDQQQKGPPKNNSYNYGHQQKSQQKKKPQTNNQQSSNQNQQRGNKKGSGGNDGNKLPNDKSSAPGSGPSLNSK